MFGAVFSCFCKRVLFFLREVLYMDNQNAFTLTDAEICRHVNKQHGKSVINKQLRDDDMSFFKAMLSDEANYIKKGVVKPDDLQHAFDDEEAK